MLSSRRRGFPTPRPMVSRQIFLLTPLESFHPQLSPSSHRINRVNRHFPVLDPLYFQTLAGCPFANPFLSMIFHFDGGVYPPHPAPSTFLGCDVQIKAPAQLRSGDPDRVGTFRKSFTCNICETPRNCKCCIQKTYVRVKPCRCNTYKKQGGGDTKLSTAVLLP
jgi:hypothetical protein